MNARKINLRVNGRAVEADVNVRTNLADFLRQQIGLTGTHVGCEHGVCGACTIIVEGRPARSCLMLAVQADGAEVETVEGLVRRSPCRPCNGPSVRTTPCNAASARRAC